MLFDGRKEVLVVSSSEKAFEYIKDHLSNNYVMDFATSGIEAKQTLINRDYDIVIINCPLKDEFGTELAENLIKDSYSSVLLLVKEDVYNSISFTMGKIGAYTLSKPLSSIMFNQGLSFADATSQRIKSLVQKTQSLQEKMDEIRLISRAKLLLMTKCSFSEDAAHKYIEKKAMDRCVKKSVIANEIIDKYSV